MPDDTDQTPMNSEKHSKYLLRLGCCGFSSAFTGGPDVIPRSVAQGFDVFLDAALGQAYGLLSDRFSFVYDDFGDCPDEECWPRIFKDELRYFVPIRVLYELMMRFDKGGAEKTFLINSINNAIPKDHSFRFSERHFELVFLSLFFHLHHFALQHPDILEWMFGDGAADKVTAIFKAHLANSKP